MNKKSVKYYENLIDQALNINLSNDSLDNDALLPKKKKLKKENKKPSVNSNKKQQQQSDLSLLNDLELVVGIYRLLLFNFKKYSTKWNFSSLVQFIKINDSNNKQQNQNADLNLVKWFTIKITSLLLGLTPEKEHQLFNVHFSSKLQEECSIKAHEIFLNDELKNVTFKSNDHKNLNNLKTNFDKTALNIFKNQEESSSSQDEQDDRKEINKNDPNKFIDFDGLKLKKKKSKKLSDPNENDSKLKQIVFVETTKKNLNKIVMSVITDNCIVVEGNLSSGKTTLIEYLADKTNNKLIKYQMDEFMDSKSLIGNYICSDIPGEFLWKPGPLYQAASQGNWILLEDFDHSPVDSLSLIIDLLETKCIKTSDNVVNIKPNFRLFLTLRPSDGKKSKTFIDSIKKLSRYLVLDDLKDDEIIHIICEKYPYFSLASSNQIAQKLLDVYKSLDYSKPFDISLDDSSSVNIKTTMIKEARTLSLRDLLKLCNRMMGTKNRDHRELVLGLLNDIYECFLCFISNKKLRLEYASKVGTKLNINRDEVVNLLLNNKPNFLKNDKEITCGRVRLKLEKKNSQQDLLSESSFENLNSKFVYTKSSLGLLEKIARSIECNEPVLLCGETGVGKTTALQHLAKLLGKKISVINLNHQTETSDLLGSFKPVDIKIQMKLVKERFVNIFSKSFKVEENQTFLNHVQNCFSSSNWKYLVKLISHATESAYKKFQIDKEKYQLFKEWKDLKIILNKLEENLDDIINKFSFQFFEGKLSQALVNGEWIILDEINLASSETLQFLGALLEDTSSKNSSVILYEKGDNEPLKRHTDFRLFGAMNPASDVGKRNLPSNIRNRFTEIFVDELDDENDLSLMIKSYLECVNDVNNDLVKSIVEFYLTVRSEPFLKKLSNGTGMPPTYSLRTLCRALKNASKNSCNNTLLSVYDSICLSFLTDLNRESSLFLEEYIKNSILKASKLKGKIQRIKPNLEHFNDPLTHKSRIMNYINIEDYWLLRGPNECMNLDANDTTFIFTKSAKDNLKRLARVCSARLPCLIQGDTSIGKTSLIKWLAQATGNVLIRINNHDHTDLQEYIGSYVVDSTSKLVFKEGLLVQAMRNGYWILLDELNLASSEVLEALNRVLDDNRELYIPETQELIRAHPRFLLFATQNPPGKYAGRKQLSRAFRNRFIELHYDELPEDELLIIVEKKCSLPKTYATLLIKTITELKTKRSQVSGIFLGKNSLITLRDLFRWAKRYSMAQDLDDGNTDWKQYLAEQGFLLLSSRCRSEQDVKTIHSCIEKCFNKKIDINNLNNPVSLSKPIMNILNSIIEYSKLHFKNFVWTPSARRLALLTGIAYKFNEPYLLVGETGVGKTTICQMLSNLNNKQLHIINCHMHSEAADFLGSMRPIRDKENLNDNNHLFEWKDGPLVIAIRQGEDFLIDEISLADDSVLERLNSVLEEEKTLLLAENINENSYSIKANKNFRIFATMNPSGDFGKKELSAALRNRFTEIWCPSPSNDSDEFKIIASETLLPNLTETESSKFIKSICINTICDFLKWLGEQPFFKKSSSSSGTFSIRDLTAWISFINKTNEPHKNDQKVVTMDNSDLIFNPILALIHGACLVFIDSINSEVSYSQQNPRTTCMDFLFQIIENLFNQHQIFHSDFNARQLFYSSLFSISNDQNIFKCGPFSIKKGSYLKENSDNYKYCFDSETTAANLQRVMRCLLMDSPIMLEGSPGVGKTSLVEALAKITQNKVIRINLSEQTDLNELFGADLPCDNSNEKSFQQKFNWHDGPFLLALKQGYWVILDEINLASQSVLEGLNSCFDHRNEIFISELNRKFYVDKSKTKIFACQNPFIQGGGRKGLPKSFLNRFSKVYVDQLKHSDLLFIASNIYASYGFDQESLSKMIKFNDQINSEVCVEKKWGTVGSPWEFNLRDLFRWCDLIVNDQHLQLKKAEPGDYIYLIFANRFRTVEDKNRIYENFKEVFGYPAYKQEQSQTIRFSETHLQIGQSFLRYDQTNLAQSGLKSFVAKLNKYSFTSSNLKHLESISKCIEMNWMVILVGKSCTGKTSLIRMLANLVGQNLIEFSVNNSTDTSDLLGGFEKVKHLKQDLELLNYLIKSAYLATILKFENNVNNSNNQLFGDYLQFMFESKNLFKSLIHIDEDFDLLNKLVNLFQNNLSKLIQNKIETIQATNLFKKICKSVRKQNDQEAKQKYEKMKFEWIDSSLVKAIENGDWVLIDNANFCTPSVLDRLNPLLERNGSLQINEKGIQNDGKLIEIKQNKNFRLILSMNESFGELSRPMRNRGVEIYLNELDKSLDIEDIQIILQSLFPFDSTEIEFQNLYNRILMSSAKKYEFNSLIQQMHFSDIFKLFKLTYDYWLLETEQKNNNSKTVSIIDCLKKSLEESNLELTTSDSLIQHPDLEIVKRNFFSDVFKMKEFEIYRFLFNFPIFSQFLDSLKKYCELNNVSSSYDLNNYSINFIKSIKSTNFINIWLKNIPIGHHSMILGFVKLNLLKNNSKLGFKQQVEKFYESFVNEFFDINNQDLNLNKPKVFQLFNQFLNQIENSVKIDLSEETINIKSNIFLCQRLENQPLFEQVLKISYLFDLILKLFSSKFRISNSYQIQADSLILNIQKLNNELMILNNKENQQNITKASSFKFLLLIKEFHEIIIKDLVNYLLNSNIQLNNQQIFKQLSDLITSILFLIEKFYLICTCSYDSILTIAYLKYYWNFIHAKLNEINDLLPNCWSVEFESIKSLFNQNLYFDDSVYKIFYTIWMNIGVNLNLLNKKEMFTKCDELNKFIISNSIFNYSNVKKYMDYLNGLNMYNHISNNFLLNNFQTEQDIFDLLSKIENVQLSSNKFCLISNLNKNQAENALINSLKLLLVKSQLIPLNHYLNIINDLKNLDSENSTHLNTQLIEYNNLSELQTKHLKFGKFYSLFTKTSLKCFNFIDIIKNLINLSSNKNQDEYLDEQVSTQSQDDQLIRIIQNYSVLNSNKNTELNKNLLCFNWLTEYISKIFINKQEKSEKSNYIYSIDLTLNFYDEKINQLNELKKFLWSNHSKLVENPIESIDLSALNYLHKNVSQIKQDYFSNDDSIFINYLLKKGFNIDILQLKTEFKNSTPYISNKIELLIYGYILLHLQSPIDPLDPLEHEILIKKNDLDVQEVQNHESYLEKMNNSKLKNFNEHEPEPELMHFPERNSKADYFFIKNEFENCIKQFCSINQLKKFLNHFLDQNSKSNFSEEEYKTWLISLEKFIEKIMSQYYSYSDIIYLPINGLSLIGYSISSLFTNWKSNMFSQPITDLVKILIDFPYKRDYLDISKQIFDFTNRVSLNLKSEISNKDLCDELNFISLLHILNDLNKQSKVVSKFSFENSNDLFINICSYYNRRYMLYKEEKEEKDKVEAYKYKTYGQKEIEQELEDAELAQAFPSFDNNFEEFLNINILETQKIENEKSDQSEVSSIRLNIDLFAQVFDLVELITCYDPSQNLELLNKILLKTFYRSYSIGSTLIYSHDVSLPLESNSSLLSHILFASSANLNTQSFNVNIDEEATQTKLYNIYHDSNYEQVLSCKSCLNQLKIRINNILNDWPNNPILIELIKIQNRIESFNLNDPLMKYLTGIELLLQKAESWQMVASKDVSLDNELKALNSLVVEWRKHELKYWLNSLDLEQNKIKKTTAFVWFFNIFSVCSEFILSSESDETDQKKCNELAVTLNKFIQTSSIGEYFIRLKNLKICFNLFSKFNFSNSNKKRLSYLNKCLWSIISYYDSIFSSLISEDIIVNRKQTEKELKEFIDIYKWQDANYWSLKQSITKSNTTLFRTLKKFKYYLKNAVDYDKLIKKRQITFDSICVSNKFLSYNYKIEKVEANIQDSVYYENMFKFCKKLLNFKFQKNFFNNSFADMIKQVYQRFIDLDQETKSLISTAGSSNKKDKTLVEKYKKDFKYLNQLKLKFISDLIKDLSFIGLSYRKGNIYDKVNEFQTLETSILYSRLQDTDRFDKQFYDMLTQSEFSFYLATNRYFFYKSIQASYQSASLPIEKFSGFTNHLFDIIQKQKLNINNLVNKLAKFDILAESIDLIADSFKFNMNFKNLQSNFSNLNEFVCQIQNLIKQIELFFENVTSSKFQSNENSIRQSYDSIKDQLSEIKSLACLNLKLDLNDTFKFGFVSSKNKDLNDYISKFENEFELKNKLKTLKVAIDQNCAQFSVYFDSLIEFFGRLNEILIEDDEEKLSDNSEQRVKKSVNKLNGLILKSIENIYKKYFAENTTEKFSKTPIDELKNGFYQEFLVNFINDTELFNLEDLNVLIKKLLKIIREALSSNPTQDFIQNVVQNFKLIKLYVDLFKQFSTKWASYLIDSHIHSCKFLNVLINIFDEFKQKGLSTPKEFEDDGESNEASDNNSKKFETDDATGLGEGQGAKDVSDQIETEDQLDDAKTKEEREKEKEEKNDDKNDDIKEEEKGIEMSEDFEADMDDVETEEKENDEEDDENEEEQDDLDDQKGSVDDAMDYLDKQLWDKEDKDNQEDNDDENEQEEPELEEDIKGGEKLNEDKSELLAKQDELPMIDNEEAKDDNHDENENPEDFEMTDINEEEKPSDENEKNSNEDEDKDVNDKQEDIDLEDNPDNNDNENVDQDDNESDPEANNDHVDKLEDIQEEEKEKTDENDKNNEDNNQKNSDDKTNKYDTKKNQSLKQEKTNKSNSENSIEEQEQQIEDDNEIEKDEDEANIEESSKSEMNSGNSDKISDVNLNKNSDQNSKLNQDKKRNNKLGNKNENRTLDNQQNLKNKIDNNANLIDVDEDDNKPDDSELNNDQNKDEYKHIKNDTEKYDNKMYDAATENQKKKLKENMNDEEMVNEEDEPEDESKKPHDINELSDEEMNDKNQNKEPKIIDPKQVDLIQKEKEKSKQGNRESTEKDKDKDLRETEEFVETMGAERPNESFYASNPDNLKIKTTRDEVEQDLIKFRQTLTSANLDLSQTGSLTSESLKLWLEYESITQQLSKELCEQLRLILEPTICSKLKGDYKTGKRLNMKRVVEYIATEYRKDKIWLRRTKPNKRDYQVLLAVDNSSSMSDNHCMQLAYETIATLTNAFNFLEVGQFGLLSFGEKVDQLHNLEDQFNSDVGARILSRINFKDDRTKIAEMLNTSTELFNHSQASSNKASSANVPVSKLLIILSDGRGVFYEGIEKVKNSVQNALLQGIFIVFVILDITGKNSSIFDIKMPIYTPGNPIPTIKSYMENFPFPFYVVLREINTLPIIMIEALKQWFEMVTKIES